MKADLHSPDDLSELQIRISRQRSALGRDRHRAVALAIAGRDGHELTRGQIAQALGRSRQFVDQWIGRYRRHGLPGLTPRKAKGQPPSLTPDQQAAFKARLLAGPRRPMAASARCVAATRGGFSSWSSACR